MKDRSWKNFPWVYKYYGREKDQDNRAAVEAGEGWQASYREDTWDDISTRSWYSGRGSHGCKQEAPTTSHSEICGLDKPRSQRHQDVLQPWSHQYRCWRETISRTIWYIHEGSRERGRRSRRRPWIWWLASFRKQRQLIDSLCAV